MRFLSSIIGHATSRSRPSPLQRVSAHPASYMGENFSPTDICKINGLARRADLNGLEVRLLKFEVTEDAPDGRWAALPVDGSPGLRVRPENLSLVRSNTPLKPAAQPKVEAPDPAADSADPTIRQYMPHVHADARAYMPHHFLFSPTASAAAVPAAAPPTSACCNAPPCQKSVVVAPSPIVSWLAQAANCFCPAPTELDTAPRPTAAAVPNVDATPPTKA